MLIFSVIFLCFLDFIIVTTILSSASTLDYTVCVQLTFYLMSLINVTQVGTENKTVSMDWSPIGFQRWYVSAEMTHK